MHLAKVWTAIFLHAVNLESLVQQSLHDRNTNIGIKIMEIHFKGMYKNYMVPRTYENTSTGNTE
jgi:hypothetical protein